MEVHILGEIEGAEQFHFRNLYCHWKLVRAMVLRFLPRGVLSPGLAQVTDHAYWNVAAGAAEGFTQINNAEKKVKTLGHTSALFTLSDLALHTPAGDLESSHRRALHHSHSRQLAAALPRGLVTGQLR